MITKIPCFLTQNMTKFTTLLTLPYTFKLSGPTFCPACQNKTGKGEVDVPLSWTLDGRRIWAILQWCRWSLWCEVWRSRMFFLEAVIASKAARYRLWWIEDHTRLAKFIGSGRSESELVHLSHSYQNWLMTRLSSSFSFIWLYSWEYPCVVLESGWQRWGNSNHLLHQH